uniref:Putative glycosyltransferase n=1 Tax=viral metagenome TaxID=1070528 RepID=A0A6M3IPB6_9ZZZZ
MPDQLPCFPVYRHVDGTETYPDIQSAAIAIGKVTVDDRPHRTRMPGTERPEITDQYAREILEGAFSFPTLFREIVSVPPPMSETVREALLLQPPSVSSPTADICPAGAEAMLAFVRANWDGSKPNVILHSSGADSRFMSVALRHLADKEGADLSKALFVTFHPEIDESRAILSALGLEDRMVAAFEADGPEDYFARCLDFGVVGESYSESVRWWPGNLIARLACEERIEDWSDVRCWSMVWGDIVWKWNAIRSRPTLGSLAALYFFDNPSLLPGRAVTNLFPHTGPEMLRILAGQRGSRGQIDFKLGMVRHLNPALADVGRYPNARDKVAAMFKTAGHHPHMALSAATCARARAAFANSWYCWGAHGGHPVDLPQVLRYWDYSTSEYIRAAICEHVILGGAEVKKPRTAPIKFDLGWGTKPTVSGRRPRLAIITAVWKKHDLADLVLSHLQRVREELADEVRLDVIVVGSEGDKSKELAHRNCAEYLQAPNVPLGAKWNAALSAARGRSPDGVVVTGSDDFLSVDLIRAWARGVVAYEMQGVLDCLVVDVQSDRWIHWLGYPPGPRLGEPIGGGRCYSARLLEAVGWTLWQNELNQNLDASAMARVREKLPELTTRTIRCDHRRGVVGMKSGQAITRFSLYVADPSRYRDVDPETVTMLPAETVARIRALRQEVDEPEQGARPTRSAGSRSWRLGLDILTRGDLVGGLDAALASAAPVVDEITVLIDRRFGDRAEGIARHYGARIIRGTAPMYGTKERDGWDHIDFGSARNRLLDAGRSDWVLVLDADEVLVPNDLVNQIELAIQGGQNCVSATAEMQGDRIIERETMVKAFRRRDVRWRYPVHNQMVGLGQMRESAALVQTSYAGVLVGRAERAFPALRKLYREAKDDETKVHAAYYLAKTSTFAPDLPEVIRWCAVLADLCPDDPVRATFWPWWIEAALHIEGLDAAKSVARRARRHCSGFEGLEYMKLLFQAWKWAEASANPLYRYTPSPTRRFLGGLQTAAKALGWPLRFSVGG